MSFMRSALIATLILAALAAAMYGQVSTGAIAGTITDPSGAAIAQAAVTATNIDTGVKYKANSNETGFYQFLKVPIGSYDIEASVSGFKTLVRQGITVQVGDRITLNLALEVGALNESVSVTAEAPLLRTQDAQAGEVINSLMISNLPQINRNPLELLRISGNVAGSGSTAYQNDTRINGGRIGGIEYMVDGNTILSGKGHSVPQGAIPSMEQVGEMKVVTNGMSAEYGRTSGGLVELATKSGTNQIHGQAFEYFHNQLLNANPWAQNWSGAGRLQFHQNDYGGQVGGPVWIPGIYNGKNRTFFTFNFEQQKYRQAAAAAYGIAPTEAERNGDLTGTLYGGASPLMYDPNGVILKDENGNFVKQTLLGGDGKHVPADRIDPLAKTLMSYMSMPNTAPTPGYSMQNGFLGQKGYKWNDTLWNIRLDHNLTDKHHLMFRFNRDHWNDRTSQWFGALAPSDGSTRNGSIETSLSWDYMISPTTLLNIRGSLMHHPNARDPKWTMNMSDWAIDPVMKELTRNMPNVNWRVWSANQDGWGAPVASDMTFQSLDNYTNGSITSSVSKIWGKHTIKTGAEHRRFYDNHWEDLFGTSYYGVYATAKENYGDPTWNGGNSYFANTWGSFLLGIPDYANKQSVLAMANASNYYAAYLQDDIKVSRNFTLNVGVRWDMETPLTERHDSISGWDPNKPSWYTIPSSYSWNTVLANAGLTPEQTSQIPTPSWVTSGKLPNGRAYFANTAEHPSRKMAEYHPWQFAPRLGGAYQINNRTVVRASFGMMYLTSTGDYWNGWVVNANRAASAGTDRLASDGNMAHNNQSLFYPDQYIKFARSTPELNRTVGNGYQGAGTITTTHPPHEYNWNFSFQRQIPMGMLVEASYNGNHGAELMTNQNISPFPKALVDPKYTSLFKTMVENPLNGQIQPIGLSSNPQVPLGYLMLDNPAFGGLQVYGQNIGRSNYHAMNLKLEKRLSKGMAFLLNYTLSRSMDNVGGVNGIGGGTKPSQSFQTVNDLYGYSPMDETHRLSFYHDVQFPFGKGRKFLGSPSSTGARVLNGIIGGWEYAGIMLIRSGRPISFVPYQGNVSELSGVGTLWGSITGDYENVTGNGFSNNKQVLASGLDDPTKMTVRRFDSSRFTHPVEMTIGNIQPIYPYIRNPGSTSYDGSLMKNFPLFREGTYLQFRVEAQNMFNIKHLSGCPDCKGYNTSYGDPNFGLITTAGTDPRNMQISARLVF